MVKWSIGTYARVRPPRRGHDCAKFHLDKINDGRKACAVISFPRPDDDDDRLHLKQRDGVQFQFNDIFDPSATQDEVFNKVCLDIVYSALDGYNGTILAYGQTGSGKTYTITGGEHYSDRGIIPRVLSTIFEEFEQRTTVRYACYISYLEIYNENVYDLLDRSHTDRPIEEWTKVLLMDDDEGDMHFRNLGVYEAVSEEEALNLLFLGNMNRVTSDTPMNQASSRSHSIFSVMIEARPLDSDVIVMSKLHLVDLAGSERVYKREGTQRMRTEGKHINLSLHHLEQVILSLRAKRNSVSKAYHIPYRNSMLTSVLRGSLGGNCKSVFIATLNPEADFLDESISSCRFMQRCSEVTVDVAVNSEIDTEKRIDALEKTNSQLESANFELQAKLTQLENELNTARHKIEQLQQQQRDEEEKQSKKQQSQRNVAIDWIQCEAIVEKLLLTGDLSREELLMPDILNSNGHLKSKINELDSTDEEQTKHEARKLYQEITAEIRSLGIDFALGCLNVMKESTFFASNTAADLQEMMQKQEQTVEMLEKRLDDQKHDTERLKMQIEQLTQAHAAAVEAGETTSIPRSKSHSGAVARRGLPHEGSSRDSSIADFSESDSDNDSENSESYQYRHPQHKINARRKQERHGTSTSSPSTISLLIPPAPSVNGNEPRHSMDSNEGRLGTTRSSKQSMIRAAGETVDDKESMPNGSPPKTSGSDAIRKRMELLKNGSLFVKYGRYGKPHVRFVWCSPDLEYLNYRLANKQIPKASIPTRTITRIHLGQATKVFERAKQEPREPFCFSIEYEEGRTLDLEIVDGDNTDQKKIKRSEWADALQFLVKLKSAQKKPASISS